MLVENYPDKILKLPLSMIDHRYEFFLVRFTQLTNYLVALERGLWFVGEHYLSMRKWELEFQAAKAMVTSLATWIRLPELPIEFFSPRNTKVHRK